jgi:oligopeptide/dipeptide ABC transporter ATP-binding protein
MVGDALLQVSDLKTYFQASGGTVRAVDGISLEVGAGEAVGIAGESGSGKSMTALSLVRLVPRPGRIAGGSVRLRGRELLELPERAMRDVRASEIAVIFQDPGAYLNPIMTIGDQIAEAIGRRSASEPEDRRKVEEALRAVQIPDPARIAASYPYELSGGMQQRAMIASVLIRRPSLIIADEPTTALDATVQFQILKFIADMRVRIGASLLLISHDLQVIAEVCDRVYIVYAGQVVEHGPTERVFASPKHPYTRALVDSILDPWIRKDDPPSLDGSPPDMAAPPSGCRFHPRCASIFEPCSRSSPALEEVESGRFAACWLNRRVAETAP